jgi:hypothetical protein
MNADDKNYYPLFGIDYDKVKKKKNKIILKKKNYKKKNKYFSKAKL